MAPITQDHADMEAIQIEVDSTVTWGHGDIQAEAATKGHVRVHGPSTAWDCVEAHDSYYHQRQCRKLGSGLKLKAILVSKCHAATVATWVPLQVSLMPFLPGHARVWCPESWPRLSGVHIYHQPRLMSQSPPQSKPNADSVLTQSLKERSALSEIHSPWQACLLVLTSPSLHDKIPENQESKEHSSM